MCKPIITILCLSFASFVIAYAEVENPNIVVIIADDLGYADMAFLPQAPEDVKKFGTPGFDRLAETGTYFAKAYGTSPICSPSRAGLITGRYQQRWGNWWYGQGGLPREELTIPEALAGAGYVCAKVGKTHLNGGPKEFPTEHGFDRFLGFMHHTWDYIRLNEKDVDAHKAREGFKNFGQGQVQGPLIRAEGKGTKRRQSERVSYEDGFTTRVFTDEAVRFIREDKGGQPFYLHIAHNAVHHPTYITEKSWAKKVGARHVPWDRDAQKWSFPYWEPSEESPHVFHQKWGHMSEIDFDGRRCYLSHLLALDHGVSRVLDTLEETGQRENTIVIFVSDNGGTINTFSNNTPLNGFKYMFGEGGIRVPMIVSMPGALPQGQVNDTAMVSTMDIMPTVLELAGQPLSGNLDGKSLLPIINGERETQHDFIAWGKNKQEWVIRSGNWKLANNVPWKHRDFKVLPNGDVADNGTYRYPDGAQLFNLQDDIGETTNLLAQHPKVAERLRELYGQWAAQMGDPGKPRR